MNILDIKTIEFLISDKKSRRGFTIVELLIVIVVIGILAAISIVSYQGIQQRARDTQRASDVETITKAIELYYVENGEFPPGGGSTSINTGWSTTADASWANLENALVPKYISSLPKDPTSTPGQDPRLNSRVYNYAYFVNGSTYCGAGLRQMFLLIYNYESKPRETKYEGNCSTNSLSYPAASNYRVSR